MRNEDRHGKDRAEQAEKAMEVLHREVVHLFEMADQAPTDFLDSIYRNSLDTQLDFSNDQNAAWLANWEPVVQKEIRANRLHSHDSDRSLNSTNQTTRTSDSSTTGAVNT